MFVFYLCRRSSCEVLWCVCVSVGLSVCLSARISLEPHAQSLPNFVCMLRMSLAWSSFSMFTIGHIAYRREGVFFPIENALSARKGGWQCTSRAKCAIYDCVVFLCDFLSLKIILSVRLVFIFVVHSVFSIPVANLCFFSPLLLCNDWWFSCLLRMAS